MVCTFKTPSKQSAKIRLYIIKTSPLTYSITNTYFIIQYEKNIKPKLVIYTAATTLHMYYVLEIKVNQSLNANENFTI